MPVLLCAKQISFKINAKKCVQLLTSANFVLRFALVCLYSEKTEAAKLRSWLGPTDFYEGVVASARWQHGFTSIENDLYVFGGFNTNGMKPGIFLA